mgnify:CR=1 FL=1
MNIITNIVLAPVFFFQWLAGDPGLGNSDSDNPLFWVGIAGVIACIAVYTILATALVIGVIVSGFHMLGTILFEWAP